MTEESKAKIDSEASVAKALFLGNILEDNLFPFPHYSGEEKETLQMVVESIDRFLEDREEDFRRFDKAGELPEEEVQKIRELGLFGTVIPEEYGGIGLSARGYSRTLQQMARHDASISLYVGAHTSIGMKGVLLFGTKDQKDRYLERLSTGELIAAFCLTEAGSGSDAASVKTEAVKQEDGSWVITGEKIWITNGPIADFFTVFARTECTGGKLSAFLVERKYEGVSVGPKEDKLGIRASATSTVSFQNVKVPAENLLGEVGKGFKMAMAILNNGRTGIGGGAVGGMKSCIELASKYAKDRKQFGQSISEFGLIKEKIAQMTVDCFATECVVQMVGGLIDSGAEDYSTEAAISKVFASEALWRTTDEALQVAGGNGYMKEYPFERKLRDARINLIFEGTNEILRLFIALSGMKEAGRYLKEIGEGAGDIFNDPIKGFGVLSGYVTRKVSQLTPLGRDKLENIHSSLRDDAEIFEAYTVELSKAVEEILKRHGKGIVGKQFASKRVADTSIDLFVGLCILSRVDGLVKEKGEEATKYERDILHIFCQQAKRRMNQNLRRIDKNEDEQLKELSDFIVGNEGYPWDLI